SRLRLPYRRRISDSRDEIHIEKVIYNFIDCDVTRAMGMVGREGVDRLARWLRFLDIPGFRNAPVIRRLIPAARMLNPAEAVSRAVNAIGQVLQEILGAIRFWADLSGITTGPQILDRVGTGIVTASKRPAIRLILFGSLFLVAEGFARVLSVDALSNVAGSLRAVLGVPILVLGSVCLVVFVTGMWFKRIAGEALDNFLRTADANFYPLIKARKFLRADEDLSDLFQSVIRPEIKLRGGEDISKEEWIEFLGEPVRQRARFLTSEEDVSERFREFVHDRETVTLLYRDFLDGPVLHRSDDKTSVQLLGNMSIQNVRSETLGQSVKERRKLEKLALEKGSILSFGPYFWFRFITESLAIETAKLILEYNAVCIPKAQLHLADEEAKRQFEEFLADHEAKVGGGRPRKREKASTGRLSGASFTAFDFLGPTEHSDAMVRERFGDEVLAALKQDRKAVVRDIFGTRPYHLLPRHQRVANPYRLYKKYLGGAKFFLLPLLFALGILRLQFSGLAQVRELVDEVLGRKKVRRSQLSRLASFDVAVRKINRMRKPLFMEALKLRAAIDVEYFGLRIPGEARDPDAVTFQDHLDFIGAVDAEQRPLRQMRERMVKDLRRFRNFLAENSWREEGLDELLDGLDPTGQLKADRQEVLRALVTAYVTDHDDMRSKLTAPGWTRRFFEAVVGQAKRSAGEVVRDGILCALARVIPKYRRRRAIFREYVDNDRNLQGIDRRLRRRALAGFLAAPAETERMVSMALAGLRGSGEDGREEILAVMKRAACDYKIWTQKLVTIRTIQTLTLLDVRNYRRMVWDVGDYQADEKLEA
ncbi:MAG: hypothetical protein AAF517_12990, partial [Planctomycetota bacterium]